MHIVIDIDGVLANVDTYITELNRRTGKTLHRGDVRWYDALWDLYGRGMATAVFHDNDVVLHMLHHQDNVKEATNWGDRKDYQISIVTTRPYSTRQVTRRWLKLLDIEYPVFHVTSKTGWAKDAELWGDQVDVWIDDSVEVCEAVDSFVKQAFLIDRPWNLSSITWILRAKNLRDVTKYLDEQCGFVCKPPVPNPGLEAWQWGAQIWAPEEQNEPATAPEVVLRVNNDSIQEPQLPGDVGYDLQCMERVRIQPGKFERIAIGRGEGGTPLQIAIPEGYWGLITGRSKLLLHGIMVSSTPIDSGYRGPIYIFVYNAGPCLYEFNRGDRIGQLVLVKAFTPPIQIGSLPPSERGERGFGSTGR